MGNRILILVVILFSGSVQALHIRNVAISVISPNAINIGVNTEAIELYYFHSAQHSISGNTITIEICYVEDFGSTIEFLNNNVEVPIITEQIANYTLIVKIYYTDLQVLYEEQNLQDVFFGEFSTPLSGEIILNSSIFEKEKLSLYPNPVKDYLRFSRIVKAISVYDITGRIIRKNDKIADQIDLSDIKSGIYFIEYFDEKPNKKTIIKQ